MKNNTPNYLTNSRVGRRWSIDDSNEENEVDNKSIMSAKENSNQDSNF